MIHELSLSRLLGRSADRMNVIDEELLNEEGKVLPLTPVLGSPSVDYPYTFPDPSTLKRPHDISKAFKQ